MVQETTKKEKAIAALENEKLLHELEMQKWRQQQLEQQQLQVQEKLELQEQERLKAAMLLEQENIENMKKTGSIGCLC